MEYREALSAYKDRFGGSPDCIVRAPGRVNLIGEHTDYTGGLVLPIAVDRTLLVGARATDRPALEVHSAQFGQSVQIDGELDRW